MDIPMDIFFGTLEKPREESNGPDADKYDISLVTNSDWLTFCQTGHRTWKS